MNFDSLQKAVEAAGFAAVPADDLEEANVAVVSSRPDEPAPRQLNVGTALVVAHAPASASLSTYASQLLAQVPTGLTRRFGWGAPA